MQIVLKMFLRTYFGENRLEDVLVVLQNLRQGVSSQFETCLLVDVFAEREAVEHITACDAIQLVVGICSFAMYARCGENNAQIGVSVVYLYQLVFPVGEFESLVYNQHLPSTVHKFVDELLQATSLEVEIIGTDIEGLVQLRIEKFLGILE